MGKGDKRTRRGKIFAKSFGKCRSQKKSKRRVIFKKPIPKKTLENNHLAITVLEKKRSKIEASWFEPKPYLHIGKKIVKSDKKWVTKLVSDSKWVEKYNFYPLIYRKVIQRRFKKISTGQKAHFDPSNKESTQKERHIFYANHLDNAIYSYYAKNIIGAAYESLLTQHTNLSACITAYRSVPVSKTKNKGKSNIHFAKDVFEYIRKQKECVALAFDITSFFDNLDHGILKSAWEKILCMPLGSLNGDNLNVYNSLIRFSYIEEVALQKLLGFPGIKSQKRLRKKTEDLSSYCIGATRKQRNRFFRNKIASNLIIPHEKYETEICKGSNRGIPQGTAISAVLANLYMLEFDRLVLEMVTDLNGFYRRYSDDIMIICDPSKEEKVRAYITDLVASDKFKLKINDAKTECVHFKNSPSGLRTNTPIKYLGFEFDGQKALIKSATLSKYHRRKKSFIKRKARKTMQMQIYVCKTQKLWAKEIWRKYSISGTPNFLSYASRAMKIMNDPAILKQVRRHRFQIRKAKRKYKKIILTSHL